MPTVVPPPVRPRDAGVAALVVVAVLAVQLPFRLHGANVADEGAIFQIATELLRGRRLYADVVHPAFPGIHWTMAAVFALFGATFDSARTFAAALFAVTTGVVFLIARWWLSRRGALAFVVLFLCYRVWAYPHWHMVSYSSLAVTLVLGAAWIVGDAFGRAMPRAYLVAGVVAGAAFLTKQDSGAAGGAALALAILLGAAGDRAARWRGAVAFAAGAAVVVAAAAVGFLALGTFGDLVQRTLVVPYLGLRDFQYQGSPPLRPLFHQDAVLRAGLFTYLPTILVDLHLKGLLQSAVYRDTALVDVALKVAYRLPLLVLVVAAASALRRRAGGGAATVAATVADRRETLLLLVAGAFWLAFNRPHDWIHLLVLYPPTLLLGTLLASRLVGRAGRRRRVLLGATAVGLGALAMVAATLAVELLHEDGTPVTGPRGVLYATAPQAQALQELVDGLAAAPPGVPVAAYPYHPLVNFITARPLLGRYIAVWPGEPDLHRTEDIERDVAARPEGLVVYSPSQVPHFQRMAEYSPRLFGYLADHFAIDRVFGGDPEGYSFFLLRRDVPPGGRSLLGAALEAAQVVVEPTDGRAPAAPPLDRHALVDEALWPFARVVRVTTLPATTVAVRYRLTPQTGDRFRTAYGLDPDHWSHWPGPRIRFAVAVEPTDAARHEVVDASLDPFHVPADRRWVDVDLDLTPWAGRAVDLVLRVTGPAGAWPQRDRAGWADPRLE